MSGEGCEVLPQFLPRDVLVPLYENAAVQLAEHTEMPRSAHVLFLGRALATKPSINPVTIRPPPARASESG